MHKYNSHIKYLVTLIISYVLLSSCSQQEQPKNQLINDETYMNYNPKILPTFTPTQLPTTVAESCTNDASFIVDLTIPDFSQITSNTVINKVWQITNTGTCDWGTGYSVVFKEGNAMTSKLQHTLYPSKSGTNSIIEIKMKTPISAGDYEGYWLLYDPNGIVFGPQLYIKISIIEN